jgi:hypothetical protein
MNGWQSVTVDLPQTLFEQVRRAAASDGDTVSEWLLGAVTQRVRLRRPPAARRVVELVECRGCDRRRRHWARGLCRNCYQAQQAWRRGEAGERPCVACGEVRPSHGMGRCRSCYDRQRYQRRAGRRKQVSA